MPVNIDPYLQIILKASSGEYVRDAICNCMSAINKDTNFTVKNKDITTKLSQLNKTYSAPEGTVWKQVTLNVTDDSGEEEKPLNNGAINTIDFEVNNSTENRTYNAKEEHGENAQWGDIIVNVDHSGEWEGIADNVVISSADLYEGTFHAEDRGYTAVKSVTFSDAKSVTERGGTIGQGGVPVFPVIFYNDVNKSSVNEKLTVAEGADATIYKVKPNPVDTVGGLPFAGWSPSDTRVHSAMSFTPIFKAGTHGEGEYAGDWNDMQIGQWKSVTVPIVRTNASAKILYSGIKEPSDGTTPCHYDIHDSSEYQDGAYYSPIVIPFMKVAEGTFLSTRAVSLNRNTFAPLHTNDIVPNIIGVNNVNGWDHWNTSYAKQFLEKVLLPLFPINLKQRIKAVRKDTKGSNTALTRSEHNHDDATSTIVSSLDTLWVPSLAEVWSFDNVANSLTDPSYLDLSSGASYDIMWNTKESGTDYAASCPEWVEAVKQNYPTTSGDVKLLLRSSMHGWARNAGSSSYFFYALRKRQGSTVWNMNDGNPEMSFENIISDDTLSFLVGFNL